MSIGIGRSIHQDKLKKMDNLRCPRSYCVHEFRQER